MARVKKPAPPPVIDLGGRVCVIDDSGSKPVWKTLERVLPATERHARRVLKAHGLAGGWLIDDTGDKVWVDV